MFSSTQSGGSTSFPNTIISAVASSIYGKSSAFSAAADPLHKNASRTLHVFNLERSVTDDALKARFGVYGHILDVDVKNRDTLSPSAFIQFTNIDSVVAAIRANNSSNQFAKPNSTTGDDTSASSTNTAQKPYKVTFRDFLNPLLIFKMIAY